jgi:NADH:ubiquinone oxidoreductase subunit D
MVVTSPSLAMLPVVVAGPPAAEGVAGVECPDRARYIRVIDG